MMRRGVAVIALALFGAVADCATLQGRILDSHGATIAGATIVIQPAIAGDAKEPKTLHTDGSGRYECSTLLAGSYTVRVRMTAFVETTFGPIELGENESKSVDLVLKPATPAAVDFFDEPKFTVAGVTDHTYVGGHGSDTARRSAEELTKATAALGKEPMSSSGSPDATETSLLAVLAGDPDNFAANDQLGRALLAQDRYREALAYLEKASQINPGDADSHRLMADADERLGKPLQAVREYARAAKLDPSETNLFDWGTELLIHGAPEPASEIFGEGIRLFPLSSRLHLGAGTALYARGEYSVAAGYFFRAVDLRPEDAAPYMFLGKLRSSEITASAGFLDRMTRFAKLQPQNAWAHYYYATSLWTRRKDSNDSATVRQVEASLEEAVRLNPTLAVAYLQLGILYADKQQFQTAIRFYKKAIDIEAGLEQAHYRLAQAYRQAGETEKAQTEDALFRKLWTSSAQELARERSELQQFVVTLKTPAPR